MLQSKYTCISKRMQSCAYMEIRVMLKVIVSVAIIRTYLFSITFSVCMPTASVALILAVNKAGLGASSEANSPCADLEKV